ncbi:uncharacterized protein LACBIDRAFT_309347 [Laccaria bicolor S238N-H82]|uniref:Predicted protein n=1 Tax=Laccaria bicolor (strain S238N-H82 / ATCC MYA-4686) TaxID=486041 RepID=B0E4P5_LACBS|nr:uncharacterized protein LACBIDRAFT_309347 [Laccaria bicolor S238N-H82]EDQ98187.1 predicted protein [Laccaria bicolor S238N-H82]|eukprot:XP_001891163.1 predicted protein [Laccaria bicolor S238N-H82]
MAVPFAATLEALEKLPANPKNIVYIISGRDAFLGRRLVHGCLGCTGCWNSPSEALRMSCLSESSGFNRL